MKTEKARLDSIFTKLDNDLKSKANHRKESKHKRFEKINSNSNVPTETYSAQ